jgi:hypothetical protein
MQKFLFFWGIVIALMIPLSAENNTVMVFGTPRGELNDTEDRILREEVMRRLVSQGITVVPVYDVERILRENYLDIRSVLLKDRKALSEKTSAQIFVYGLFSRSADKISFLITVSDLSGKALGEKEIPLDLKQPIRSQWQMIAESVSAAVKSILSPSPVK